MPCVRWDPSATLFYWSFDPTGEERIPEKDWEKHGIPKLRVETWIGTSWPGNPFEDVLREFLWLKNYDLDGKQYALDRGWPTIALWDPHNPDTGEWEQPDVEDEVVGRSDFTSPSSCSLVEVPNEACVQSASELDGKKGTEEGAVARWMTGLFKKLKGGT
ncbi:hypothetical protein V5O48_004205 [Marasmius crinis-equi]|uniref:Uncharacterized protein n=1 Tax=Marasmius crinis-equi TaxID=585013 RepID=A0ABR3FRH2_9AGAR